MLESWQEFGTGLPFTDVGAVRLPDPRAVEEMVEELLQVSGRLEEATRAVCEEKLRRGDLVNELRETIGGDELADIADEFNLTYNVLLLEARASRIIPPDARRPDLWEWSTHYEACSLWDREDPVAGVERVRAALRAAEAAGIRTKADMRALVQDMRGLAPGETEEERATGVVVPQGKTLREFRFLGLRSWLRGRLADSLIDELLDQVERLDQEFDRAKGD